MFLIKSYLLQMPISKGFIHIENRLTDFNVCLSSIKNSNYEDFNVHFVWKDCSQWFVVFLPSSSKLLKFVWHFSVWMCMCVTVIIG